MEHILLFPIRDVTLTSPIKNERSLMYMGLVEIREGPPKKIRPKRGSPKKYVLKGGAPKNAVKKGGGGVTFIQGNYVGSFLLICLYKR